MKKALKIILFIILAPAILFAVLGLFSLFYTAKEGIKDVTTSSNKPKLTLEQQMVKEADEFIVKHKQLDIKTFEKEIVSFLTQTISTDGEFFLIPSSNYKGNFIASYDNFEIKKMNFKQATEDGYKFTYFIHRFSNHYKLPIIASSFNVVDMNITPNQQVLFSFGVDVAKKAPKGAFDKSPLLLKDFIDFMNENTDPGIDVNGKTNYKLRCMFRAH
ncbi:hypothetical protein HNQ82_001241 [Anoxybacillus tengchongensis]|uniref:Uncharacterized protein n=1 Tax=Anoxybacillus tengchongensis TaxID=576944 RepID=A0A7W9YQE5_9BACL|nr:hypothetical protein [Anoxybacillus tengchongensis]MBB6176427.1 hypothetical protein [Anoxybacillus tengchongensis]